MTVEQTMDKSVIIIGLKKAAIVLHSLAFMLDDKKARDETLSLVISVNEAIKSLEAGA